MQDETYVLQHFGFCATQVTLERKHLLKDLLESGFESMIKKATPSEAIASRLNSQTNKVIQNIFDDLKNELEEIEALDRHYFNIPPNVLLPNDFEHAKNYTEDMETELDKEIKLYKQKYLENSIMIASLEQQEAQFEKMKPFIEQHFKVVEKLESSLEVLNRNKLNNVKTLICATKQVVERLEEKENE